MLSPFIGSVEHDCAGLGFRQVLFSQCLRTRAIETGSVIVDHISNNSMNVNGARLGIFL